MGIVTVGIDLAKNAFAIHGADEAGKPVMVRPNAPRAKLMEIIAGFPPCLIGMVACSGAHHWAREFQKFGNTVSLLAHKFVAPYRLSGTRDKNYAADAVAISEAVTRPSMRFVPARSIEQQGQLTVHRARAGFVEQITATLNRICGLLSDLGIVLPLKAAVVRLQALQHEEDLPGWANTVIGDLLSGVSRLDERIAQYDRHIQTMARQSTPAQQLIQLSGIVETSATALISTVGNGHDFSCGRQFCAWLGLCLGNTVQAANRGRGHHQGVRPVPAQFVGTWCESRAGLGHARGQLQARPVEPFGQRPGRTARLLASSGGSDSGQERQNVLGGAAARGEFQYALLRRT